MAVERNLLTRLRAIAAQLDDDALATLANRGLVRRARKDLQSQRPIVIDAGEELVRMQVEACTVAVREPLAASTCSCAAGRGCRHVLAALLDLGSSSPAPAADGAELLSIDDGTLRRFAGARLFDEALAEVAGGLDLARVPGPGMVLALPRWNADLRWFAGAGLEGMLCSCRSAGPCLHKVAAVLAWQVAAGARKVGARVEAAIEASAGAVRSRDEVRAGARDAVRSLIRMGASRLSPGVEERLRALALSAHSVDLPRLERMLAALAEDVSAFLQRRAEASCERILARAAAVDALARALADPTPTRVGRHRLRYEEIAGPLELVGVGARPWRSRSGWTGLTVYFWDVAAERWCTWTDARPDDRGFDPRSRFRSPGPWAGCDSPAQAAANRIRLQRAWRTPSGRLAGRPSTSMTVVREHALPPGFSRWSDLVPQVETAFASELEERDERADVVLLRPRAWGEVAWSNVRQALEVELVDLDGRKLTLVLRHAEAFGPAAIESLEAATHGAVPGILALLRSSGGRLVAEPVSLWHETGPVHLGLDATSGRAGEVQVVEEHEPTESGEPELVLAPDDGPVGQLLAAVGARLESVAEAGAGAWMDDATFEKLAGDAERIGLASLAASLRGVIVARAQGPDALAEACLRAAWVLLATLSAATVETAAEQWA